MTNTTSLNNVIATSLIAEKQQASGTGFIQTQLSSTLAAIIYKKGCTVADAVAISSCLADSLVDIEYLVDIFVHNFQNTRVESTGIVEGKKVETEHDITLSVEDALLLLVECKLLDDDGNIGDALIKILEQDDRLYIPTQVGKSFERKHKNYGLPKKIGSLLMSETITHLESSQFTIDSFMLNICQKVQAVLGGAENDPEAHVLAGCLKMNSNLAYTSEFKADLRGRLYQAACSGPNGQASDRSRSLMDLYGVTTDYNVEEVKSVIKAEVMDMVNVPQSEVGKLMTVAVKDPVGFIVSQEKLPKRDRLAPKMYSFVKAAFIWKELMKGNKPYIGMAVGLDAKCSGPQLAALLVGDSRIAAACGMSLTVSDDAYELAIQELSKVGFTNFTRSGIKKAYMGIFYGQGYAAFMDLAQLVKDEQWEILDIMNNSNDIELTAKEFHKAVSKSFGPAMNQLRKRFKNYAGKVAGKLSHVMPDGFKIEMNYKVKHNIHDVEVTYGVDSPDVVVSTPSFTHKFIKLSLNTNKVDTDNFVRNGFVNMIQGTDALLARLIITHLAQLGAKHIIAVHDCFRVNVTEMHLLKEAIIRAYLDLFGSEINTKTMYLPEGTDIIANYFKGLDKSLVEGAVGEQGSQFIITGNGVQIRKARKLNGHKLSDIIKQLGTSYYFAK